MIHALLDVPSVIYPFLTIQASSKPFSTADDLANEGYRSCTVLMSQRFHLISSMVITLIPFKAASFWSRSLTCVNAVTVSSVFLSGKSKLLSATPRET